jgi:hypothetical protein
VFFIIGKSLTSDTSISDVCKGKKVPEGAFIAIHPKMKVVDLFWDGQSRETIP